MMLRFVLWQFEIVKLMSQGEVHSLKLSCFKLWAFTRSFSTRIRFSSFWCFSYQTSHAITSIFFIIISSNFNYVTWNNLCRKVFYNYLSPVTKKIHLNINNTPTWHTSLSSHDKFISFHMENHRLYKFRFPDEKNGNIMINKSSLILERFIRVNLKSESLDYS